MQAGKCHREVAQSGKSQSGVTNAVVPIQEAGVEHYTRLVRHRLAA
jgi:hypothetical protein